MAFASTLLKNQSLTKLVLRCEYKIDFPNPNSGSKLEFSLLFAMHKRHVSPEFWEYGRDLCPALLYPSSSKVYSRWTIYLFVWLEFYLIFASKSPDWQGCQSICRCTERKSHSNTLRLESQWHWRNGRHLSRSRTGTRNSPQLWSNIAAVSCTLPFYTWEAHITWKQFLAFYFRRLNFGHFLLNVV